MKDPKSIKSVAIIGAGASGISLNPTYDLTNRIYRCYNSSRISCRELFWKDQSFWEKGNCWRDLVLPLFSWIEAWSPDISRIYDPEPNPIPLVPGYLPPDSDPPLGIPDGLPKITSPNEQERFDKTPIYNSLTWVGPAFLSMTSRFRANSNIEPKNKRSRCSNELLRCAFCIWTLCPSSCSTPIRRKLLLTPQNWRIAQFEYYCWRCVSYFLFEGKREMEAHT